MNQFWFVPCIFGTTIVVLGRCGELAADFWESIGSESLPREAIVCLCPSDLFGRQGIVHSPFCVFPWWLHWIVSVLWLGRWICLLTTFLKLLQTVSGQ